MGSKSLQAAENRQIRSFERPEIAPFGSFTLASRAGMEHDALLDRPISAA
jgi:hypothetical protein